MCGDTCQLSPLHSCNTNGPPFDTSWKDPEGNRWSLKAGGVGIDDWGFWQAARHELGAGLDGGADLTTLFKHDTFWEKKRACMQPEECFWQRPQRRAGRRSDDIVHGWWSRRSARDARKDMHNRVWRCRASTGEIFDKTQHLVQKATQAKDTLECFWLWRVVPRSCTLQDTKLGIWRQFGNGVLTEACTYIFGDGSGKHSDPQIRRVVWAAIIIQGMSNCLGQPLRMLEATQ